MGKVSFRAEVRPKINKKGRYNIIIRVIFASRDYRAATHFEAGRDEVTQSSRPKLRPNLAVTRLVTDYVDSLRDVAMTFDPVAFEGLSPKEVYLKVKEKREKYLLSAQEFRLDFPDFYLSCLGSKKLSTSKSYLAALRALCAFMEKDHFDIRELSSSRLKQFEENLYSRLGRGSVTPSIYVGHVKHVHALAQEKYNAPEMGRIPVKDVFRYFKVRRPVQHRRNYAVSRETIQYIINIRNDYRSYSAVRKAIDLFLLIFSFQGMNVADMLEAPAPVDGIVVFNRRKTKDSRPDFAETQVRIQDCVMPLYKEHCDPDGVLAFSYGKTCNLGSFHVKAMEWMKQLREVLKSREAPVPCRRDAEFIRYYSARHSYGTVSRSMGIDKGLINDGLSHVDPDMSMTDIYIRKDWKPIWEANRKMLELFDWSPLNR